MTTRKFGRTLLVAALALSLVLSITGGTIAWFTDSVESANNVITAGNLDVELYKGNTKVTNTTELFELENPNLWEPGVVAYENLTIKNAGSLNLYYTFSANYGNQNHVVDAAGTTTEYDLTDVLKVALLDAPVAENADRAAVLAAAQAKGVSLDQVVLKGSLAPSAEKPVSMVIYWEPTANDNNWNVNNGKTVTQYTGDTAASTALKIDLGVKLIATQVEAEKDAFGPDYDINAKQFVNNSDQLEDALKNGGYIGLNNNITLPETVTLSQNANVALNLSGNTLTGSILAPDAQLNIQNGSVANTNANVSAVEINSGELTLTNVNVESARHAVRIDGAVTATIDGGTYKVTPSVAGKTQHALNVSGNANVTINGGTFIGPKGTSADSGSAVKVQAGATVTINGGNFSGGKNKTLSSNGTLIVKGGTFDQNPSAFVPAGYEVTNNGNGTWTVGGYAVSTGAELADAIANGKAVELTQDVTLGKIDLTDAITDDVLINANGHKITTTDAYGIEVTPGKNVTISNADVVMTKEGDYITYAAGLKIANGDYAGATITLKNCTIKMANTDWAYAVNMPASVKNLNLVIDGCTLEGAIAVQCWGDNNTINITNSKLICNYTTNALYTSYCVALQMDDYNNVAENNALVIDNCEFAYSGVDNFNSVIKAVKDLGSGNTVTVTNCTYDEKVTQ